MVRNRSPFNLQQSQLSANLNIIVIFKLRYSWSTLVSVVFKGLLCGPLTSRTQEIPVRVVEPVGVFVVAGIGEIQN